MYFAELGFKGYGWDAVLAMLEDCARMGMKPSLTWNNESYTFDEAMKLADEKGAKDSYNSMGDGPKFEVKSMKKELEEAYEALNNVKSEINEVNLLNSKLLYLNKVFKAKNLTESQKVKVLAAFDKATSKKEAQLVYETVMESLNNTNTTKRPVTESVRGMASKVISGTSNSTKQPIIEVNAAFERMQKLAGIKK